MYSNEGRGGSKMSNTSSETSPERTRRHHETKSGKFEKSESDLETSPPALPPRPNSRPPQQRAATNHGCSCGESRRPDHWGQQRTRCSFGFRKYVCLCVACGTLCIILGAVFLTVYFMLKSYTSSLNYFETVPTYVPSAMLMTTGFLVCSLGSRKNRSPVLMKICGACSMTCALVCLSVTVTTAVIHMNRLQTLRECYYTGKTRSCTCESVLHDSDLPADDAMKFVFNSTSDCEVIHGVLYSCLRAVFGLSVVGILVCIFTCMLVYQLLSHERKKMYWAQLEMRCRYLYGQHGQAFCSCCDDCRFPAPGPHDIFPWELMGNRFLAPGRIGNLYTPNPEDRTEQSRGGWSWRRLPWARTTPTNSSQHTVSQTRAEIGSPDSQYGFTSSGVGTNDVAEGAPYTVIDSRARLDTVLPGDDMTEGGFYSWGPPPPYSSGPNSLHNSPARRTLSGMFSNVSSLRRNHNVSPVRLIQPRVLRPPLIFERQMNQGVSKNSAQSRSTCRQPKMPSSSQNPALQAPSTSGRANSSTSIHHTDHKQENYENLNDLEQLCTAENNSGFNTLPSLKKRHQVEASTLFGNKPSSGSFDNVSSSKSDSRVSSHGSDDSRLANDASSAESQVSRRYQKNDSSSGQDSGYPKKRVARKLEYEFARPEDLDQNTSSNTPRKMMKPPRSHPVTPEHRDRAKNDKTPTKHSSGPSQDACKRKIMQDMCHENVARKCFDNFAFQNGDHKNHFQENFAPSNRTKRPRDPPIMAERPIDCESDIYFADISNSSCYMSLRPDMPEDLYEEADPQKERPSGKPLLNKTNLKIIEKESVKFDKNNLEYQDILGNSPSLLTESVAQDGSEQSLESFGSNRSANYPSLSQESSESRPKSSESYHKPKYEFEDCTFTSFPGEKVGLRKITSQNHLPNQFRPVREQPPSNDEQSSGSLTCDSGISSNRNYLQTTYYCEQSQPESISESECGFDISKDIFRAAILQKPKAQPRSNKINEAIPQTVAKKGKSPESLPNPKPRATKNPDAFLKNTEPFSKNSETFLRSSDVFPKNSDSFSKISEPFPKPLPRTIIVKQPFLAPDAQYELTEKVSPRLVRPKPTIPARPPNLKMADGFSAPRRRSRADEPLPLPDVANYPTASHSVNV